MRKGVFSLEILVDNKILPEYEVPSTSSENSKQTRSRENQNATYVAVPRSPCHFCIRVGVHSPLGPMVYKGIHYVDGKNDDTYMELDPLDKDPYTYIYGFYNFDRTIFHKFKFDTSYWSEDDIFVSNIPTRCTKVSSNKQGFGVVSVNVFTAERLAGLRFMSQCRNNQEMISELPDNFDPLDVIYLDEPQKEPMPNLKAIYDKPVAELYIRYQTKEWLRDKGFLIKSPVFSSISNPTLFKGPRKDNESKLNLEESENDEEKKLKVLVANDIDNDDKEIDSDHDFEDDHGTEDEEFESKSLKEKNKFLNSKSIEYITESRILDKIIIPESNIVNEPRVVIDNRFNERFNQRFNEKVQEVSTHVKEEKSEMVKVEQDGKGTNINNVTLGKGVKSEDQDEVEKDKKKHRSKKIKYYSDTSIDWSSDNSSDYNDSSSEDEFVSLSKKRLRT
ncbi:15755_t:CDS:2 [Funneliformis mosseae]|uniref:15755_t:CDS:1 n=1 Tax=Funneliformis mosseae TaxID=27381 RepID=A0A9N8Z4K4_FUNMO|nr:15755_t:CDS:2 [Funneliformis mosseae]